MLPTTRPSPRAYFHASSSPRYSLIFALPLLLLYEGLAAALSTGPSGGVRNGADVILTSLFIVVAGRYGPLLFMTVLIGVCIWLISRDLKRSGRDLRAWVFGAMFAESVVLSLVFGVAVSSVTTQLLSPLGQLLAGVALLAQGAAGAASFDIPRQFMVSLGAGLYEELLFRVVLVSGLTWIARTLFGWKALASGIAAMVASAFIFSAFHYVGAYGDPLELRSFAFRFIAGLAFSGLYLLRGFGITAWTHALYDVFLLVF
jgi:hypothetical protein